MDRRSALHYVAAGICAATIPKHTLVGLQKIKPACSTIPDSHMVKHLIPPTWMFCNLYLAMSALLSVRWAKTGGPFSAEEKAIAWLQALFGAAVGLEYFRNKMYVGLGVLWAAPAATLAALI